LKAGTGKKIIDQLREGIEEFTDGLSINIQHELFQAEERVTLINFVILGVSSASILLSIFIVFMLGRSIINPIKVLTEGTKKIGNGNLEHKINVNTQDEFGTLSDSFNKMTEDLRKSKEELIAAKDYTDNIIKSMADSLIIVDPDSKISMVNNATCDLLGYDAKELVGKDIGLLFPKEEGDDKGHKMFHGTGFKELTEKEFIKGLERTYLTKTGNWVPTLFSGSVMRDKDGSIRGIICLASDISELKQAEEAFRTSEEKLARSRKMESMGLLAGGVAHDLNNVLSGIVSYPEIILIDLPADSKLRKPIEAIQESGLRAAAIVQDLLTVARGVAITKKPLNLNNLIRDYFISPEFKKLEQFYPAITVKTDLHNDLFNVSGSRVHISKAVMNLVSNAVEAIEGNGKVTISTANRYVDRPLRGYDDVKMGEYAVLAVCDDGSGIS
jgi:two-component system cell cycle sensor histidine kinase/response regulator CckA